MNICDDIVANLNKMPKPSDNNYDYHFFIINILMSVKENCIFAQNGIKHKSTFEVAIHCRILIEVWANLHYILKDRSKTNTERYVGKISKLSQRYFNTLIDIGLGNKDFNMLYKTPKWTGFGINRRVELLGETAVMEYEILSRFTHADCWVMLNNIWQEGQKGVFTVSIITGWLIEAMNQIFYWLSITDKVSFITRLKILRFRYDVKNKIMEKRQSG